MTLIKKADVEMHFAERQRQRKGLNLVYQANKSATGGLPAIEQGVKAGVPAFIDDFAREHSVPGGDVPAFKIVATSEDSHVPESPKTTQS